MKFKFILIVTVAILLLSGCSSAKVEDIPTLSILGGNLEQPDENAVVSKKLEEKLGIKLNYIDVVWEKRHDMLDVMVSAGNTPDLFSYGYIMGEKFDRLVNQDVILELSPYLEDYPNIKKRMKEFEFLKSKNGGKIYFIPIKKVDSQEHVVIDHAWFYRKDIIDDLGLQLPTNAQEFYTFLKQIKQMRPDHTPFTLESSSFLYSVFDLFDARIRDFEKVDGRWQSTATNDNMKQAVRFLKQLWDEGLLDREYTLTPNWNSMIEKFMSGASPVIYTNYKYDNLTQILFKNSPEKNVRDVIAYLPVMTNTSGEKRVSGSYNFYGGLYIKNDHNEELIRKRLALADFMMSDEGMLLMRYGMEGVHYEIRDGIPYSLLGKTEGGIQKRLRDIDVSAGIEDIVNYDNLYVDSQTLNRDYIIALKQEYHGHAYISKDYYNYIPNDTGTLSLVQLEKFASDSYVRMISESTDFEKDWAEFQQQYNVKGGNKISEYLKEEK